MSIAEEMRAHLEEKLLPFWKNLKDNENGGYYGFMDADGKLDRQAVKGCILNSRILWFFSSAWMALQDPGLKEYADHAYLFLKEHCLDRERGGVYWSVTWDGKPEDTTKHTYNQAFAVYALSCYYAASGCREALELALELQEVIEGKCFDQYGYKEALDVDFQPADNDKLSENGVMADRTMNTLLHVFEAYTELLRERADWVIKDREDESSAYCFDRIPLPGEMPTAFVCNSDLTASRMVKSLLEAGYRVPEDVSLVGYDDWLYPGLCDVPISTYSVNMPQMAKAGIDILVRRIGGDDSRCNMQIIEGEIVLRDSVRRYEAYDR